MSVKQLFVEKWQSERRIFELKLSHGELAARSQDR